MIGPLKIAVRWLTRNAATISLVLAVATIACVAGGVSVEEHARRTASAPPADPEPLEAVVGGAAAAGAPAAAEKVASSHLDLVSDVIYETAQILLLNMSPRLGTNHGIAIGRILAVILVVFLGIQALGQLLAESSQTLLLMTLSRHHIVCGLGRVGWPIAQQLLDAGERVLILERDPTNERIDDARRAGAIVLLGDATDEKNFELARLGSAKAAYLVTGSDEENIESAVDVGAILERSKQPHPEFKCLVHIVDPLLDDALNAGLKANASHFQLQTFNVTRNTARQLIVEELTAIRPTGDEVALYVLVGFGPMGETLATHLAELAHFENRKRARILILADDPKASADAFLARWGQFTGCDQSAGGEAIAPVVAEWSQIRFDPVADEWGNRARRPRPAYRVADPKAIEYTCNAVFAPYPKSVFDREFLAAITRLACAPRVKPAIIFCHERDHDSYSTAVHFERSFRTENGADVRLPLFVWLQKQEPLKRLLQKRGAAHPGATLPIRPFGLCSDELKLHKLHRPIEDHIGMVILAGYRGFAIDTDEGRRQMERAWYGDAESNLHSNRMAALHFEVKLACLGLRLVPDDGGPSDPLPEDRIEVLAEMEHNRWTAERLLAGVSYGPRSNVPPRRPQLCTWDVLNSDPELKKEPAKDFEQIRTVFANLKRLGYKAQAIVRPPA